MEHKFPLGSFHRENRTTLSGISSGTRQKVLFPFTSQPRISGIFWWMEIMLRDKLLPPCDLKIDITTVLLCYVLQNNFSTTNCRLTFTIKHCWRGNKLQTISHCNTWHTSSRSDHLWLSFHPFLCYINVSFLLMIVDNENGIEFDDDQSPSSPTNKSLPRSVSGTTVSSQGTQSGKSKKPFFKKVTELLLVNLCW